MAAFVVISTQPNEALAVTVMTEYKDAHYTLSTNAWLVADTNKTTQEVCEKLNIKPQGSLAIVLKADGYFGYAPQTVWEWLKVKGAGP